VAYADIHSSVIQPVTRLPAPKTPRSAPPGDIMETTTKFEAASAASPIKQIPEVFGGTTWANESVSTAHSSQQNPQDTRPDPNSEFRGRTTSFVDVMKKFFDQK